MISYHEHKSATHVESTFRETQKGKKWRRAVGMRAPDGGQLCDAGSSNENKGAHHSLRNELLSRGTPWISPCIYYRPFVSRRSQGSEITGNSVKSRVSPYKECQIWTQSQSVLHSDKTVRSDESLSVQPQALSVPTNEDWLTWMLPRFPSASPIVPAAG